MGVGWGVAGDASNIAREGRKVRKRDAAYTKSKKKTKRCYSISNKLLKRDFPKT